MKLLAVGNDAKTVKGEKLGFLTGILYLAPANLSGFEVCPQRSAGCTAACLFTAGRGAFNNVRAARINKTHWYFNDRPAFMAQLVKDIEALIRKAEREGLTPAVRLNGTSDIAWERVVIKTPEGVDAFPNIMAMFPDVQFYDYTKVTKRAIAHAKGEMPANYHLTFSLTESNDLDAWRVLSQGGNVAAVFHDVPERWGPKSERGYTVGYWPVIDGTDTDVRFLDDKGVIVGLCAKGKARKDTSGFVR